MADNPRLGGRETNQEFADHDATFRRCCALAGVAPTKRQASKYKRRQGRAWLVGRPMLRVRDLRE